MAPLNDLQKLISAKFDPQTVLSILKNHSNSDEVQITKIDLGEESKKGDSYFSTIVRFSITFNAIKTSAISEEHTVHMIAKSLPKNIGRRKTFRSADFFENEVAFYNKVWPELDAFQKSKKSTDLFTSIPACFSAYADGTNDYIVLENLSFQDYGQMERSLALDLKLAKTIVNLFARFHALAFAYKDQKPELFEALANNLKETYFSESQRNWFLNYQNKLKNVVVDAVQKELPQSYMIHLNTLFDGDFFGKICKNCAERGPYTTITHGDAWVPNFLIKHDYKTTAPLKVALIDFQFTRCASLSLDLLFFLYVCINQSLREKYYDELLVYYVDEFNEVLKSLGSSENLLTVQGLKSDMKNYGAFAVGMSMEALIMTLLDDDEVSDLDDIQGDVVLKIEDIMDIQPLKTKEKRLRIAEFIKHAVDTCVI